MTPEAFIAWLAGYLDGNKDCGLSLERVDQIREKLKLALPEQEPCRFYYKDGLWRCRACSYAHAADHTVEFFKCLRKHPPEA